MKRNEMMDGPRYIKVLDDKLERFMEGHDCTHFLQDSAPCHTSKLVKKWFADRPHITLIKWPGNSPDLNPIENAWNWMKVKLRESMATNMEDWKRDIVRLWVTRMDDRYLQALVESMPRRMTQVLQKEGAMTKY